MPELPEVQTMVSDLNKKIIGKIITAIWCDAQSLIKSDFRKFEKEIINQKIKEVKRKGKNILIFLKDKNNNENILLIHPKMTGHLLIGKWEIKNIVGCKKPVSILKGEYGDKANTFIHLLIYFKDGYQMAFSDVRKFGKILYGKREYIENLSDLKLLGPDPLDKNFKLKDFEKIIKNQNKDIKRVLLNQNIISGIGNIYADEILWLSQIHPLKKSQSLTAEEIKKMYQSTKKILKLAIKLRGSSMSDYRDTSGKSGSYLNKRLVYKRQGLKCFRCQNLIKRIKIQSRSAHFCPICQKP